MGVSSVHTAPCILRGELHPSLMPSAAVENPPHDLLSMADFLKAVEMLSGEPSKPGLGDVLAVFVACSVTPGNKPSESHATSKNIGALSPILPWKFGSSRCRDGVVHCVGHIVGDPHNGQRVILTRVCFF